MHPIGAVYSPKQSRANNNSMDALWLVNRREHAGQGLSDRQAGGVCQQTGLTDGGNQPVSEECKGEHAASWYK